MAVSHRRGGLNLGTGWISLAWLVLIVACVTYLSVSRRDTAS